MESRNWSNLPEHIIVCVFEKLSFHDRLQGALSCRTWAAAFKCANLWRLLRLQFDGADCARLVRCVSSVGEHVRALHVSVDQAMPASRQAACRVLSDMSCLSRRRLERVCVEFTGSNPYFYAGGEFLTALGQLFRATGPRRRSLTSVRLARLPVAIDDRTLDALSEHNARLEELDVGNAVLVCRVTWQCVARLVHRCQHLVQLSLFNCSLSERALRTLAAPGRAPLRRLALLCRRDEKYGRDIGPDVWRDVARALPALRVSFTFDHTCPIQRVADLLLPQIPVEALVLETFTYVYVDVRRAAAQYARTLRKLVLRTPIGPGSGELNGALVELATRCERLTSLHVFCVLERATVETILALHPQMERSNTYTLKYVAEPHPWIAGNDADSR